MGIDTSASLVYGTIVDVDDLTPEVVARVAAALAVDVEPPDDGEYYSTQALNDVMEDFNVALRRRGLVVETCGSFVSPRWVIGREVVSALGDGDSLATTTLAKIARAMRLSKRHRATLDRLRRIIPSTSPLRLVLSVMLTAP